MIREDGWCIAVGNGSPWSNTKKQIVRWSEDTGWWVFGQNCYFMDEQFQSLAGPLDLDEIVDYLTGTHYRSKTRQSRTK